MPPSTQLIESQEAELRAIVDTGPSRPTGWTLWVIAGGKRIDAYPCKTGDRCKAKARQFFGGSATRGERFAITGPGGAPWIWAHPELGSLLRFKWRPFALSPALAE